VTDAECIDYLRKWGIEDCINPKMQEAVSRVCDIADNGKLTKEEQEKLEWLLDRSFGRPVKFLERLLTNGRTFVTQESLDRLMRRYNDHRL
jgi:hypothetical protein